MAVNWKTKNSYITPHFSVHEALWLPSWRIYHKPSAPEKKQIIRLAEAMENIRGLFNRPITIHCWIRPLKVNAPNTRRHGKNYNRYIGSRAKKSAHIFGQAVDFHIKGYSGKKGCRKARQIILPHLKQWGIRMENNSGGWIHIDNYPVKNKRFFKP